MEYAFVTSSGKVDRKGNDDTCRIMSKEELRHAFDRRVEEGKKNTEKSQGSTRTPQETDRCTPEAGKKRKASVSAVATVVADTGLSYWAYLEQAKSALDKGIITQEDYDDLKQHYMKKLKEM